MLLDPRAAMADASGHVNGCLRGAGPHDCGQSRTRGGEKRRATARGFVTFNAEECQGMALLDGGATRSVGGVD